MKQRQKGKILKESKKSKRNNVLVKLGIKCNCQGSASGDNGLIQFTPRYLRCQSSMPIRIFHLLIGKILSLAPMTKTSIFGSDGRLLKDADRLYSLKKTCPPTSNYITLQFTVTNNVTSFANCSCLSAVLECDSTSSFVPRTIRADEIEHILSSCPVAALKPSPSSRLSPSISKQLRSPSDVSNHHHDMLLLRHELKLDKPMTNQRADESDEIDQPSTKRLRIKTTENTNPTSSWDCPLDLTMKKHSQSE